MAKKQGDLIRLKSNKKSIRFNDLERILNQHSWELQSTTGSHHVYGKAGRLPIMIVRPHGNHKYCHPMDVNKVIAELTVEEKTEEADDDKEDES
jgi:predicted RNA binding protein YcfA (HicA-like mRNA interferase family)